ncbi:hypothetical protein [Allocoleopsis sp.]|uniref:hypothetical protein n=1 Tax=Allocoleopsis sp. TaxID=3088169 RepID=UPI002FD29D23
MLSQSQPTTTNQTIPAIAPIDPTTIVENGESPTAIILAIAILIAMLFCSMTGLVRVIVVAFYVKQSPLDRKNS